MVRAKGGGDRDTMMDGADTTEKKLEGPVGLVGGGPKEAERPSEAKKCVDIVCQVVEESMSS